MVEQGWTKKAAAEAAGVSEPTVAKWVRRIQEQGEAGLLDRSSAPKRVANRTPDDRIEAILTLRRARFTGPEIAELLGMPASTTSLILKREGIGRLPRLDAEPPNRYERKGAGELIHVNVKKLGRIEHPGHRQPADHRATIALAAPAGNTFTSPSTTQRVSLRRGAPRRAARDRRCLSQKGD